MGKKSTKVLSGALATTSLLGGVMGAVPAFAATNIDAMYKSAFDAVMKAKEDKSQESITAARKAISELTKHKELQGFVGEFSKQTDAVQQKLFEDFYSLLFVDGKKKDKVSQEDVNKAREFVKSFDTFEGNKQYTASWSTAVDGFQQVLVVEAHDAVVKAMGSKDAKDIEAAQKLVSVLAGATNVDSANKAKELNAIIEALKEETRVATVKSVTALNSREFKVEFSEAIEAIDAVDGKLTDDELKAFKLTVNKSGTSDVTVYENNVKNAKFDSLVAEDGKSVILTVKDNNNFVNLQNGDKYTIDIAGNVLNAKTKDRFIEKYAGQANVLNDKVAPELAKTDVTKLGKDKVKLTLTFNKPVDIEQLVVDGVTISNDVKTSDRVADYTYEVVLDGEAYATAGKHEVKVYNVLDKLNLNQNVAKILKASYELKSAADDNQVPYVTKVVATGSRTFKIVFNEFVEKHDKTNIVIQKGNYTFVKSEIKADVVTVDPVTGASIWEVEVQNDAAKKADYVNKLYADGETSVDLKVSVEGFKDLAKYEGTKYVGNVTLTKELDAPVAKRAKVQKVLKDNDSVLVIFDRVLDTNVKAMDKVKVKDNDGVYRKIQNISVIGVPNANGVNENKGLQITFDNSLDNKELPLTVEFAKDAVKHDNGFESVGNKAFEIKSTADVTGPEVKEPVYVLEANSVTAGVDAASNETIFTVNYATEMEKISATRAYNYTLDGEALPANTKIELSPDKKVVKIVLPEGTVKADNTPMMLGISKNVKTAKDEIVVADRLTKQAYTKVFKLQDNTRPVVEKGEYLVATNDDKESNVIRVTFSEKIDFVDPAKANDTFKVVINGTAQKISKVEIAADGKTAKMEIEKKSNVNQEATITVLATDEVNNFSNIVDKSASKNNAKVGQSVTVKTKTIAQ